MYKKVSITNNNLTSKERVVEKEHKARLPQFVIGAILINKLRVLLEQRTTEPFKDYWRLPAGLRGFNLFSDPIEAARHEVYEGTHSDMTCGEALPFHYIEQEQPTISQNC